VDTGWLLHVANAWLASLVRDGSRYAVFSVRFDAVLVSGLWPRHLPDVWRPPE